MPKCSFKLCICVTAFLFVVKPGLAVYQLKVYMPENGLPNAYVLYTLPDSHGYLWIATNGGVSCYDGTRFLNYEMSDGLPSSYISTIFEDSKEQIWVGTNNGLAQFSGGQFITYSTGEQKRLVYISSFFESDHRLLAFSSEGTFRFQNNLWREFHWNINKNYGAVISACHLTDSSFLIVQRNAISLFSHETITCLDTIDNDDFIRSIKKYNDTIYVLTSNHFYRLDGHALIPLFEETLHGLANFCFMRDQSGEFWIATDQKGLFIFDHGKIQNIDLKDGLPHRLISDIHEDHEGNIWLSSERGLVKVSFSFIDHIADSLFLGRNVSMIYVDRSRKVYFGVTDHGITKYDGVNFWPASNQFSKNTKSNFIGIVMGIAEGVDGNLWASTNVSGLYQINKKSCTNLTARLKISSPSYGWSDVVFDSADSSLYLASEFLFRFKKNKIDTLLRSDTGFAKYISHIGMDYQHRIWICFGDGRQAVLNHNALDFIPRNDGHIPYEFSQIYTDDSELTWFASSKRGLIAYAWQDGKAKEIYRITKDNGLPSNDVMNMVIDRKHFLWASTRDGLARLDLNHLINGKFPVIIFTADDGYPFNKSDDVRLAIDWDENVWAACYDGVIRIRNNDVSENSTAPVVHITAVDISNDTVSTSHYGSSQSSFFHLPLGLELPYNKNDLAFTYQGITFSHSDELSYSFRLLGLNDRWSIPSSFLVASFYHLPPGAFTFEVRARKNNSAWSDVAAYSFFIEKPFWKTWWFLLSSVFAMAGILIFVFRIRVAQVRKREAAKAEIKTQMQQLEMKALKAQMNPHFIFNSMNAIQSYVVNDQPENAMHYIGKFGKLLRQVLENSDQPFIALHREIEALRLYIELEAIRFNGEFEYSISLTPEIDDDAERIPPLILQPYVENALWHGLSKKNGSKKLSIIISSRENFLNCSITDNGIGRKKAEEMKGSLSINHAPRGLSITQHRLQLLNNHPGQEALVVFEDLYENGNGCTGTRVIIRIPRSNFTS